MTASVYSVHHRLSFPANTVLIPSSQPGAYLLPPAPFHRSGRPPAVRSGRGCTTCIYLYAWTIVTTITIAITTSLIHLPVQGQTCMHASRDCPITIANVHKRRGRHLDKKPPFIDQYQKHDRPTSGSKQIPSNVHRRRSVWNRRPNKFIPRCSRQTSGRNRDKQLDTKAMAHRPPRPGPRP